MIEEEFNMDFINTCILNMFCQNNCVNYNQGCTGFFEQEDKCSAYMFIKWLRENGQNIGDLIKQTRNKQE